MILIDSSKKTNQIVCSAPFFFCSFSVCCCLRPRVSRSFVVVFLRNSGKIDYGQDDRKKNLACKKSSKEVRSINLNLSKSKKHGNSMAHTRRAVCKTWTLSVDSSFNIDCHGDVQTRPQDNHLIARHLLPGPSESRVTLTQFHAILPPTKVCDFESRTCEPGSWPLPSTA